MNSRTDNLYTSPQVEVIEIEIEKGFAASLTGGPEDGYGPQDGANF